MRQQNDPINMRPRSCRGVLLRDALFKYQRVCPSRRDSRQIAIRCKKPRPVSPPPKRMGNGLPWTFRAVLLMEHHTVLSVHADKQLRNACSREPGLHVDENAVRKALFMAATIQLAIRPLPISWPAMAHLFVTWVVGLQNTRSSINTYMPLLKLSKPPQTLNGWNTSANSLPLHPTLSARCDS